MFLPTDTLIRLNFSHSHSKTILAEQRFYSSTKIFEIKNHLSKKYGTLPEYMKFTIVGKNIVIDDDEKTVKDYSLNDYDKIHVTDSNPYSIMVQNNFDDLSTVKKYEISEEDYEKRENTVRKYRKIMENDVDYKKINENNEELYKEEALSLVINHRCLLGDGQRRGEIMYIGLCKALGHGYWIGIKLDEPLGDSDGSVNNKKFFECEMNFGVFVRPNYVKIGDFPIEDLFNENEDEI